MKSRLLQIIIILSTLLLMIETIRINYESNYIKDTNDLILEEKQENLSNNILNSDIKYIINTEETNEIESKYISKNKISAAELNSNSKKSVKSTSGTGINIQSEYSDSTKGIEDETKSNCSLDTLTFIVDITDTNDNNTEFIGNTSTKESYSGIVKIKIEENTEIPSIKQGKTYVFEVLPMIETGEVPTITAVKCTKASKKQIEKLEKIRKNISNYDRLLIDYDNMSLEDIIKSANKNYATWTQNQIIEFNELIKNKGYTDKFSIKSYVKTRKNLSGSYLNNK